MTAFGPGDEVFGIGDGAFAEYVAVRADKLARKPANLTFEQAAAVPLRRSPPCKRSATTAQVQAGQRVLVIGASGGVGTFAVQIAKAFGAEVTGVCSTAKVDLVRSLGADHVIDYTREDFAAGAQRYDVILDIGGQPLAGPPAPGPDPRGTLVIVGGETGGRWLGGTDRQLRAHCCCRRSSARSWHLHRSENAADLRPRASSLEAGPVSPAIDRTYPLDEVTDAVPTSPRPRPRQDRHHRVNQRDRRRRSIGAVPTQTRSRHVGPNS